MTPNWVVNKPPTLILLGETYPHQHFLLYLFFKFYHIMYVLFYSSSSLLVHFCISIFIHVFLSFYANLVVDF